MSSPDQPPKMSTFLLNELSVHMIVKKTSYLTERKKAGRHFVMLHETIDVEGEARGGFVTALMFLALCLHYCATLTSLPVFPHENTHTGSF